MLLLIVDVRGKVFLNASVCYCKKLLFVSMHYNFHGDWFGSGFRMARTDLNLHNIQL